MKYIIKKNYFISINNTSFLSTLFLLFLFVSNENLILNQNQEVHMIIRGKGSKRILGDNFPYNNFEVIINDVKNNNCGRKCDLNEELNNITIKFNETIESCYAMFYAAVDKIEIDLSDFDTSNVVNMENMYKYCSNLISINLSYLNMSFVENISSMFCNCTSLKSVHFSNLATSKLKYIDNLFNDCKNLTSIIFQNFDTSSVIDMSYMFLNVLH